MADLYEEPCQFLWLTQARGHLVREVDNAKTLQQLMS